MSGGRQHQHGDIITLNGRGSTGAEYIVRRSKRDRPSDNALLFKKPPFGKFTKFDVAMRSPLFHLTVPSQPDFWRGSGCRIDHAPCLGDLARAFADGYLFELADGSTRVKRFQR